MEKLQIHEQAKKRFRAEGWWRDTTPVDDFRRAVAKWPDKVAIVGHRADADAIDVLSFRQLGRLVDRFAGGLLELGVRPGDVVSFQLPNWWHFAGLVFACNRIGAVTNPIATSLRRRELGFILERVKSRVCVVPNRFGGYPHGQMLAQLAANIATLSHPFVIGPGVPRGAERFDRYFLSTRWEERYSSADLDSLSPDADDLAQIQFTSGTTGEPKGVMHTHNTLSAALRALPEMLGLGPSDIGLMASPLGHQTGYIYGCLTPLTMGMKVVYQDHWDAARMLALIQDEQVTWTFSATTFVVDAISAQREKRHDLSSLRWFATGGAPIPPHVVELAQEVLRTRLAAMWGMTENGAVTGPSPEDPADMAARNDGRPVPWMEVRIADAAGANVPANEVGRLLVRGASQCLGYYRRPDIYGQSVDPDGWFDTGDLARMDKTRAIRITGRAKDIIIRGGENIPVLEVESALYGHPNAREVAVVGYLDERLGERACAVIVPEGKAPTLAEVQEYLESLGMTKRYWPERLEVVRELPKTASGKIQKYLLKVQLGEGKQRRSQALREVAPDEKHSTADGDPVS